MADFKLQAGEKVRAKVVLCEPRIHNGEHKNFKKADKNTYWLFDVILENGTGEKCKCEYASPTPENKEIIVGFLQYIRCGFVSPKQGTPEIEPYDPELPNQPRVLPHIGTISDKPPAEPGPVPIRNKNSRAINIQGSSMTFATAYSKDLLIAEMKNWDPGRKLDLEDINRMIGWAVVIDAHMCASFEFQGV